MAKLEKTEEIIRIDMPKPPKPKKKRKRGKSRTRKTYKRRWRTPVMV